MVIFHGYVSLSEGKWDSSSPRVNFTSNILGASWVFLPPPGTHSRPWEAPDAGMLSFMDINAYPWVRCIIYVYIYIHNYMINEHV